jgi:DNA polymerase III subunit gamma/tau
MAYEPLHHKYRPQTFGDLVGQETISLTLSNALEQEKIAPAYLFTGPRGTGKTSSARILAKSLNCLNSARPTPHPCGKCEVCLAIAKGSALDVMEIDAASNTGVDNIREIIERSRFAPVQCRYKIYVVDECHMLSTAAFNALLKTLEEPPAQVVFILATTDPQRVLSTIISRCQRFDYRRIPLIEMTAHLRYIAEAEKIAIADDALTLVAQIANGGLRDAESLLDQLSLLPETITVEKVWDLVGAVPEQDLLKLLQAIKNNDSIAVLQQCRSLLDRGREPLVVLQNLASFYLNLLIAKTAPQHAELTAVTEICWQQLCAEGKNWPTALILRGQQHLKEAETQLKRTTQPRLWLEVTLLGLLPEAHAAIPQGRRSLIAMPSQTIPSMSVNPVVTPVSPAAEFTIPPAVPRETTPQAAMAIERDNVLQSTVPQPDSASTQQNKERTRSDVAQQHFTNQPTTAANPPSTAAPNNYQDRVTNQEIWTKVVSCLQPPTTQALLKQQCHLVSFDGLSAIVGISSSKLQKLNQGKVPNIEAAFAQVCQRKVRVQLEVAGSQSNMAKKAITSIEQPVKTPLSAPKQPPNPPPPSTQIQSVENPAIQPQNFPSQNQATPISVLPTPLAQSFHYHLDESTHPQVIATQNAPVLTPPAIAADLTPAIKTEVIAEDYVDSELQQAIASLTQSFEGELVELDNPFDEYFKDDELFEIDDISTSLERPDIAEYNDEW